MEKIEYDDQNTLENGNKELFNLIIQAMIDFSQQIDDLLILEKIITNLAEYSIWYSDFMISHPLYSQTKLIDHLISLFSDPNLPPSIKVQASKAISSFIPYFNEDQINSMVNLPFIQIIYELFIFYSNENQKENKTSFFYLSVILMFLSKLARGSLYSRNTIILKFPILEKQNKENSSFESKTINIFNYIYYNIKFNSDQNLINNLLIFLKDLCFYPLSQNAYEKACLISIILLQKPSNENSEILFKIIWYICKNGFGHVVGQKSAFYGIFNAISFFKKSSLKVLKCWLKIMKSIINLNVDLTKCFDLKIFSECVSQLEAERTEIILRLIDYLISDEYNPFNSLSIHNLNELNFNNSADFSDNNNNNTGLINSNNDSGFSNANNNTDLINSNDDSFISANNDTGFSNANDDTGFSNDSDFNDKESFESCGMNNAEIIGGLLDNFNSDFHRLKEVYLKSFLRYQILIQLKTVISTEYFSIELKVLSLKILKTIVNRNDSMIIREMIRIRLIKSILEIIELHDILITSYALSILLVVMNISVNNGMMYVIIAQMNEISGLQLITAVKEDIETMDDCNRNENSFFGDVCQMAELIIKMISDTEIDSNCHSDEVFVDEDGSAFIRYVAGDESNQNEAKLFQSLESFFITLENQGNDENEEY